MNQPATQAQANSFVNSYARLPERFFARVSPLSSPSPRLLRVNRPLVRHLGLDAVLTDDAAATAILSGQRLPGGSDPLAMAYAGHQFGGFAPSLGDGRAILLGEVRDRDGTRRDVQLKGAGRTPFSRSGDGRAVLGPGLREYVVSEAMHALGIPTTRALAIALTGETVMRERPFPGAMLTRVASSHVRVGTFEFFAARQDTDGVRRLADYVIERHFPDLDPHTPTRYRQLFERVCRDQASLVARWMHVGFIHGVMNTDNMQVAGETIDYGPCAFMDVYDPGTVYSFIDRGGRYAYENQPAVAHWNLACLARAMLSLFADDEDDSVEIAQSLLEAFPGLYRAAWRRGMRAKLGLEDLDGASGLPAAGAPPDGQGDPVDTTDDTLARELLELMRAERADFTRTFRALGHLGCEAGPDDDLLRRELDDPRAADRWLAAWRARLSASERDERARKDAMQAVNPVYIPRNHLVENAIQAGLNDDFAPFERLCEVLARPYEVQPGCEDLTRSPRSHEEVTQTFCGT